MTKYCISDHRLKSINQLIHYLNLTAVNELLIKHHHLDNHKKLYKILNMVTTTFFL